MVKEIRPSLKKEERGEPKKKEVYSSATLKCLMGVWLASLCHKKHVKP